MRLPYYMDDVENKLLQAKLEILSTRGKPQESFISSNIAEFKNSKLFKMMNTAEKYYVNENDIESKKRKTIGEDGKVVEDLILPNNQISHPSLRNTIDEKVTYVFGKPFSIKCENEKFREILEQDFFDDEFMAKLKRLATDAYKKGISYLQPGFDKDGKLDFKFRSGDKIIPFWRDDEHRELDAFILFYQIRVYDLSGNYKDVDYIEFVDESGVYKYTQETSTTAIVPYDTGNIEPANGHFNVIVEDENGQEKEQKMLWEKLPLIAFKANADEYPILKSIKSLIDGYDTGVSDLADSIGDLPYSIKIIVNYDGQDLGELARNLYKYRMVKVTDGGDVKSLTQSIDVTAINSYLDRLKDDICEYGRTVNDKSAIAVNASGKALDRLYNKIDTDAGDIITEFKQALQNVLWFIKWYLKNTGAGDFTNEKVQFVFNTDKPTDETTIIANCVASKGIISDETILANHPWVTDVEMEKKQLEKQQEEQMNQLLNMGDYGQDPEQDKDLQNNDDEQDQQEE